MSLLTLSRGRPPLPSQGSGGFPVYTATHYVDVHANVPGASSDYDTQSQSDYDAATDPGTPCTLACALAHCGPGDVIQCEPGVYVGTDPDPGGSDHRFLPAFRPSSSGSVDDPIVIMARHRASAASTDPSDYSDIRSGATTSVEGWPAIGSYQQDYIHVVGFYVDETASNCKGDQDSAPITMRSGAGLKSLGCIIECEDGYPGNHSCLRFEDTPDFEISDFDASGATGGTNKAGIILYNAQGKIHNFDIHDCTHGIQPKGADLYSIEIYDGYIHDVTHFFRFHGPVKGPSGERNPFSRLICYNASYIAEFTTSSTHVGEPDGVYALNCVFDTTTLSGWNITLDYKQDGTIPRDNAFANNIYNDVADYLQTFTGSDPSFFDDFGDFDTNCLHNFGQFADGSSESGLDDLTLSEWQSTYGQDQNSITSDPLFVDASGRDYRLQAGSPCRGAGIDRLGQYGPVGGVIDMGAYPTGTEHIGIR